MWKYRWLLVESTDMRISCVWWLKLTHCSEMEECWMVHTVIWIHKLMGTVSPSVINTILELILEMNRNQEYQKDITGGTSQSNNICLSWNWFYFDLLRQSCWFPATWCLIRKHSILRVHCGMVLLHEPTTCFAILSSYCRWWYLRGFIMFYICRYIACILDKIIFLFRHWDVSFRVPCHVFVDDIDESQMISTSTRRGTRRLMLQWWNKNIEIKF